MVIDIDGFLDRYTDEPEEKKPQQEQKINLEFEKDVESRISEVRQKAKENESLMLLKKLYTEMKKFDEDLPKKFLGIGHHGDDAIKDLGEKYSSRFLVQVKENARVLSDEIIEKLHELHECIQQGRLTECVQKHFEIVHSYHKLPREFMEQKLSLSSQIKKAELLLAKKIENFSHTELENIKKKIKHDIAQVLKLLKPGNAKIVEENIEYLEHLQMSLPQIFIGSLAKEKHLLSQALLKAETFVLEDYKQEFEEKEEIIHSLKEKYHKYLLEKHAQQALLIYNEIILHFRSLPEVFLEKKIELFKEINTLYSSLNEALVQSNINSFVENYNASKVIEETRDYIRRIRHSGRYSKENVEILHNKVKQLPMSFQSDRAELERILSHLLSIHNNQESPKPINPHVENLSPPNNSHTSSQKVKKEILRSFNEGNKALLQEMNDLYKSLKQTKSKEEKSEIYRKLIFYLDLSPLSDSEKEDMKKKISAEMS